MNEVNALAQSGEKANAEYESYSATAARVRFPWVVLLRQVVENE
jgi:hypothetical protein